MSQLALFEGSHLPRTAAREALLHGDLASAHSQLSRQSNMPQDVAEAARLERIMSALRVSCEDPVQTVHEAFASALAPVEPPGFLSDEDWFRLYARHMAGALEAEPVRRFRNWLGAHFALAADDMDAAERAARRIVESRPPGPAWIEAARVAFAFGEAAMGREWIHGACLDSSRELAPEPPGIELCGVPALDAAPSVPTLPPPLEDAFDAARALSDLPAPWTRWVAVVGEIDNALAPVDLANARPGAARADGEDPARAFLEALRAARRSRERDTTRGPGRCSDRELRARKRMKRLAPALLERYVQGLSGSLF